MGRSVGAMAVKIDFTQFTDDTSLTIISSLQRGEICVVPLGDRYVFIADAFNHEAVNKIGFLRNSPAGTSLQVLVSSMAMADGITQNISPTAVKIANAFWPGPLSMLVRPHMMLTWNLGDDGDLSQFALRIPEQDYLRTIVAKTGPVVIANANYVGQGAIRNVDELDVRPSDIAFILDAGVLEAHEVATTVIADREYEGVGIEYLREGAITFAQIDEVIATN
jgi:L-threonylcarbamoyladenylate synthase